MNKIKLYLFILLVLSVLTVACSKEEEVRKPDDIMGVWSPDATTYLEFSDNNSIYHLTIEYQDGESIGHWTRDVYYYEPGYNLVIYLSSSHNAAVYQIVEQSSTKMTWCWVEDIEATSSEDIGKIIGQIINQAQEGFKLDPALYQSFQKISEDKFFTILESLDIDYPW